MKQKIVEDKEYRIEIKRKIKQTETSYGGTNETIGYVANITKYSGHSKTMYRLEDKTLKRLIKKINKDLNPKKRWRLIKY